jgi:hypothetical protein
MTWLVGQYIKFYVEQIYDDHYVLHWLHDQMLRYAMDALAAGVHPKCPEILWKKYATKFADDVQGRHVLYRLQAVV